MCDSSSDSGSRRDLRDSSSDSDSRRDLRDSSSDSDSRLNLRDSSSDNAPGRDDETDAAPFGLDQLVGAPRVAGLAVSPDGTRLVCGAQHPTADASRFVGALYALDPSGLQRPRRLTRSEHGESAPAFAPDGSLLFVSKRAIPHDDDAEDDEPAAWLWRLPAEGGEPEPVACPPAGVEGFATAERSGDPVVLTALHHGAGDWADDAAVAKARREQKVSALLITDFPSRHWDRWLAPRSRRLFTADAGADPHGQGWTDLEPDAQTALDVTSFAVTPDGSGVVVARRREDPDLTARAVDLVAYERTGDLVGQRPLLADGGDHASPAISPDGRWVACVRSERATPDQPGDRTLALIELATGEWRDLLPGFDRFPEAPVFTRDGAHVLFTADDDGHGLPFAVDLHSGAVRRLAPDGLYTDLCPASDGVVYALRSSWAEPPRVVALDVGSTDQQPRRLPCPGDDVAGDGPVERVRTTAADGVEVAGWLVRPAPGAGGDSPAPLAVFIHGGPVYSWNGWSWRWNPQVLAAHGWAVLLPDPALSTGYGLDFVARGWGRWGAEPYTDLMALTDAVADRDDVDGDRTAAMGGSFGGYMANWVAGQTDRFDAIVTHASLWNLEAFHGTTDFGVWWEREFGDPYADPARYRRWSPRNHVASIRTPMLVIHGTNDYRVPESEALTLWTDLRRHGVESAWLHFPDENHWVLTPKHARLWYETVLAWLDHHVLGRPWRRPHRL